jgi:hypothetical protein
MENKNELKTIKTLLIVLIITTAATAGLLAFNVGLTALNMAQSAPVATYFAKAIVASGYYDENGEQVDKNEDGKLVDSKGKLMVGQTVYDDYGSAYEVDKNGTPQLVEDPSEEEGADDGVVYDEEADAGTTEGAATE